MLNKKIAYSGLILLLALLWSINASAARGLPDFTDLVGEASPSVVNISTTQTVQQRSRQGGFPPGQQIPDIFRHFFEEFEEQQPNNHASVNASPWVQALLSRKMVIC